MSNPKGEPIVKRSAGAGFTKTSGPNTFEVVKF